MNYATFTEVSGNNYPGKYMAFCS